MSHCDTGAEPLIKIFTVVRLTHKTNTLPTELMERCSICREPFIEKRSKSIYKRKHGSDSTWKLHIKRSNTEAEKHVYH